MCWRFLTTHFLYLWLQSVSVCRLHTAYCNLSTRAPPDTWPPLKPPLHLQSLGGLKGWAMHHHAKEERDPPKMEGNEAATMSASSAALDSPTSVVQAEQAQATLTPLNRSRCRFFCQPWCLLFALILLLLSLLGSWAVVHLTLGTNGGSPFRISASYDQRMPQDDTATIEPHFTTNCTMGK